jgi:17beta-estradiol 17-dehydrogenase / very-long-chain 3-oxoacyl-CoA reductase
MGDLLRPGKNLSKYGSWEIMTDLTNGIERQSSIQLASHRINLILVERNPSKLKYLTNKIQAKYRTQVKIVVVDFSGE